MKIRYEEAGVVRPPLTGEWIRGCRGVEQARFDFTVQSFPILREIIEAENDDEPEPDAACAFCPSTQQPIRYDGLFYVCEDCDGGEEQARAHHEEGWLGEAGL